MIEVFKILCGLYNVSVTAELFTLVKGSITRGHHLKLNKENSRLDIRKKFFFVNPWNSLSDDVVSAPSVMSFESRLDKAWKDQPMKYNYKEDLKL